MSDVPRNLPLKERLARLKIIELDEEIFGLSYYKARKYFSYSGGGLDTSRLIKSLIWQDYTLIKAKKLDKIHGNIRTYWYLRVKPLLFRAKARNADKKYDMMINNFATMVRDYYLFRYIDFGFRDQHRPFRLLGSQNRHIIVVAEKVGMFDLLQTLWADYGVTVMAFTGQPSLLSTEYLLRALRRSGFDLDQDIPVFTIVDFDPAGYSIADSFINRQLKPLGYRGQITRIDLAHPDRLSLEELNINKIRISTNTDSSRVGKWITEQGGGLHPYGIGKKNGPVYGLQADAFSDDKLIDAFSDLVSDYLEVSAGKVVRQRLSTELIDTLQQVFLRRHFGTDALRMWRWTALSEESS